MAILYEIKQRKNPLKPTDPAKFYAQIARSSTITTKQLAEEVAAASTVSRADIQAVFTASAEVIQRHLKNSNGVRMDGIGIISPQLDSEGVNSEAEFNVKQHIKAVKVRLLADKELKDAVQNADFDKVVIDKP